MLRTRKKERKKESTQTHTWHTWSMERNGNAISKQRTFFHDYYGTRREEKKPHTPRKWSCFGVAFCNSEELPDPIEKEGTTQIKTITTTILILINNNNMLF